MCVLIFYMRLYPEHQERLFMAILFTLRVFGRNLVRGSPQKFYFSYFRFDVWPGIWTVALYPISQLPTTLSTRLRRFLIGDKMKVEIIKRFRDIGNRLTVIFFLNSCLQRNSTVYDFEDCLTVILTNKIEWNKASGLVV